MTKPFLRGTRNIIRLFSLSTAACTTVSTCFVYEKTCAYMLDWADRGVISYEGGEEEGNLHAQGVMTFAVGKTFVDNKLLSALRKHYRDHNA